MRRLNRGCSTLTIKMRLWQGYRADAVHFRLFVQVTEEGWTATIYDRQNKREVWTACVNDVDEGKQRLLGKDKVPFLDQGCCGNA